LQLGAIVGPLAAAQQGCDSHSLPHLSLPLHLLPCRPSFQLHVVGSNSIEWALASGVFEQAGNQEQQHVVFHGWISDDELELLYSHTRVAVAPLLSGAGVKGKVNQAMALGVPVVGTPVALEGTQAVDGRDCLIADTPQQFAEKLVQVYTNCTLWSQLAEGGRANIRRHFSPGVARLQLQVALDKVWGAGPEAVDAAR
jgi:glycosyltransferase involved in cell wall biosynthesis